MIQILVLLTATATLLQGCTQKVTQTWDNNRPMVLEVQSEPQTTNASASSAAADRLAQLKAVRAAGVSAASTTHASAESVFAEFSAVRAEAAVEGQVTFAKAEILGREFLYGSDLQYTSVDNDGMLLQAIAIGHIISKFKIVGDRLQLLADQKHLFESDINHPERLIHEFPIITQDSDMVTVAIRHASPILATVIHGDSAAPVRTSWIRSVEFVRQGNYLLIESSIEHADGTVAEYMESVFPRETLVANAPQPILADADQDERASRFRFLSSSSVYLNLESGRTKTQVAERFPLKTPDAVIEWYATSNTPAKYLPVIKAGLEGWNRYSQKMWNRDFVRFNGILPAGVKIGDPRYNVISWDSIPDAGAAYESQASDPLTGLQSHSLIYLPYAWVRIGLDYWANASHTQDETNRARIEEVFKKGRVLGKPLGVRCLNDMSLAASLEARRSAETFANELLKQVLFHEVGHALGLAHNFKGSLSFDPEQPSTVFSTSIMDYNQFHIEDRTFDDVLSANGPLLEYDRQIVSVLYNDGKDVKETDPVVPACDDSEADNTDGGVDPLCLRYDSGADPTLALLRTIRLIRDPQYQMGRTKSLAASVLETVDVLGDASTVSTEKEASTRLKRLATQLAGTTSFYYSSGAQGLANMLRVNMRSLYVFGDGVLPSAYDERGMRLRVLQAIAFASSLQTLEAPVLQSLSVVEEQAQAWLRNTPYLTNLPSDNKDTIVTKLMRPVDEVPSRVETRVIPRARLGVIGGLVQLPGAPFFFTNEGTSPIDLERFALDLLERTINSQSMTAVMFAEKARAAQSLLTFRNTPEGQAALERVVTRVRGDLARTRNTDEREAMRGLLRLLQSKT